eukprot:gene23091-29918_t
MGFIQADVCTDAMIVERSKKYETVSTRGVRAQLQSIWELVQRRAVWKPCAFIFVLSGTVFAYSALVLYRRYLFDMSWHTVYIGSTLISVSFNIFLLVLVLGLNNQIGMGAIQYEIILAMGAYGVIQFVVGIQFLPACRMFIGMCPEGSEGASYAMLTTLSNVSAVLAYSIASVMATVFDVSSEQLSNHNYSGMWKLTLLCGCIQFTGLFFLPLLPTGLKEQIIRQENDESSPIAGAIFVFVVGSCLLFILTYTAITVAT